MGSILERFASLEIHGGCWGFHMGLFLFKQSKNLQMWHRTPQVHDAKSRHPVLELLHANRTQKHAADIDLLWPDVHSGTVLPRATEKMFLFPKKSELVHKHQMWFDAFVLFTIFGVSHVFRVHLGLKHQRARVDAQVCRLGANNASS